MTAVPLAVPDVSVVLPCLDEAATLAECVRRARRAIAQAALSGEVIVADNGSRDGCPAIAEAEGARLVAVPRRGYGHAVRAGLAAARGRFVVLVDADLSYDLADIPRLIAPLAAGADLVMGTRLLGEIDRGAMPALHRRLGTPLLTALVNRVGGLGLSDVNSGFRAVLRERLPTLELRAGGMELASEMLLEAARLGLDIVEVPIAFHRTPGDRKAHLRPIRDGARHLTAIATFVARRAVERDGQRRARGKASGLAAAAARGLARVVQAAGRVVGARRAGDVLDRR